jgi:hypothetical protein
MTTEAGIGHNQRDVRADTLAELRDLLEPFKIQRERYLKAAKAAVVRDRGTAGDAGDLIKLAGEIREKIQSKRMEVTRPLRDAADAAKGEADQFWQEVDDEMDRVLGLIDTFRTDEADKIKTQQREQDEMMARLAPKPAPVIAVEGPAPHPSEGRDYLDYSQGLTVDNVPLPVIAPPREAKTRAIRGTYGARVGGATEKTYTVEDLDKVPRWIMETETVKNAIAAVAKSFAKHHPNIPGIAVHTADVTRVR